MSKQQQCGTIYAHLVGMPFGIHSVMCGPVLLSGLMSDADVIH